VLSRLAIRNYKSLHEVSIDVPSFCALVGANAAGKSNFADAVDFLSSVARNGLPAAVTEKGGYENICFRRVRRARAPIEFSLVADGIRFSTDRGQQELRFTYTFAFRAAKQAISSEFSVCREELRVEGRGLPPVKPWQEALWYRYPRPSKQPALRIIGEIGLPFFPEELLRSMLNEWSEKAPRDDLFLTSRLRGLPPFAFFCQHVSSYRVFQVMPPHTRRPASASGSSEMGRNGENLPAALAWLRRERPEAMTRLVDHLRVAVPTVERLETDYVETRELGLFIKEEGTARREYASELSDGTLRTIGIFVPIVDPRYPLVVMEEPENCIHPWVTRQFVNAARELSETKQVLLTTHSPVLVSKLRPEELLVVERERGETRICPVTDVDGQVGNIIRKGIMDLGAYWDSGAMRAVPTEQLPLPFEEPDE